MIRSVIAVTALVACSGAWGDLGEEEKGWFRKMGSCHGLYFLRRASAGLHTEEGKDLWHRSYDQEETLYKAAQLQSEKLKPAEAFQAGYEFQSLSSGIISVHRSKVQEDGAAQAENWMLARIIDEGCEQL